MTVPETKNRFHLPSAIRLLTANGVRGHTLIFTVIMGLLFGAAYAGRVLAVSQAWTVIFLLGGSTTGTYLIFSALTMLEGTRRILVQSRMKSRIIILALVFAPILAGLSYWIQQVGSVEALPIFPGFIAVFYGWVLLQAYFIATPVSNLLGQVENRLGVEGGRKKVVSLIGPAALFLPIVPLIFGVWGVGSWASSNYQNVQGATDKIVTWTILVTVILLLTYFVTLRWSWSAIRGTSPQAAVFVGGTFLVLWGYLLYRAASILIGYVTQNQASNPLLDAALIFVSIMGAMQTFARKTLNKADSRWAQTLPFLVFAFGSAYAVAQFYFLLQLSVTRVDLSILVNATVFVTGLLLMMFLIRRHLVSLGPGPLSPQLTQGQTMNQASVLGRLKSSWLPWKWKRREAKLEGQGRVEKETVEQLEEDGKAENRQANET